MIYVLTSSSSLEGTHFCSTKTLKMPCAVYHKVPKLWLISYNNGLRQNVINTLLVSSLADVNGNFSIPLVSVKGYLWYAVSTPTLPTHTLSDLCWVEHFGNTNRLLLIQISWKSEVVLRKMSGKAARFFSN